MKLERGIDVAKAIYALTDTVAIQIVNEHNCRLHDRITACDNQKAFQMAVKDYRKRLLNVLTR